MGLSATLTSKLPNTRLFGHYEDHFRYADLPPVPSMIDWGDFAKIDSGTSIRPDKAGRVMRIFAFDVAEIVFDETHDFRK
jgi:hypothetical protein